MRVCSQTPTVRVEPGDRVRLEYVGRFEDGTVFATSRTALAEEHGLVPTDRPLVIRFGRASEETVR
jgi:FKBP-type peptidyl-prolyl cis-trans isomerase 2